MKKKITTYSFMAKGYIYIMTNPSFEEYVKIGYAEDVNQRRDDLNSSSAVPFAFRIYATYEVDSKLADKNLHSILDMLNPNLRATEKIDGKIREREFYAMEPEDAYAILKAIAKIHGYEDRLEMWKPTVEEQQDEKTARAIKRRMASFMFSMCNINKGEEIEFWYNRRTPSGITCTVVDDRHVEYNGKIISLSALAQRLLGVTRPVHGTNHFKYKDEWLNDIRRRCGN